MYNCWLRPLIKDGFRNEWRTELSTRVGRETRKEWLVLLWMNVVNAAESVWDVCLWDDGSIIQEEGWAGRRGREKAFQRAGKGGKRAGDCLILWIRGSQRLSIISINSIIIIIITESYSRPLWLISWILRNNVEYLQDAVRHSHSPSVTPQSCPRPCVQLKTRFGAARYNRLIGWWR